MHLHITALESQQSIITATDDAPSRVLCVIWNSVISSRNLIPEPYCSRSTLAIAGCHIHKKMGERLHSNFCSLALADCNEDLWQLNVHIQQRQLVRESQIPGRAWLECFCWVAPPQTPLNKSVCHSYHSCVSRQSTLPVTFSSLLFGAPDLNSHGWVVFSVTIPPNMRKTSGHSLQIYGVMGNLFYERWMALSPCFKKM